MRNETVFENRNLLLLDARRASAKQISTYVDSLPGSSEVWAIANERLIVSSRISHWIRENEFDDLIAASERFIILYVRDFNGLKSLSSVPADVDMPTFLHQHDFGRRWSRSAVFPRGFFKEQSRSEIRSILDGFIPERLHLGLRSAQKLSNQRRPSVLFVCHTDLGNQFGGVQKHVSDLIDMLRPLQRVYFMTRHHRGIVIREYGTGPCRETVLPVEWPSHEQLENESANIAFSDFIKKNEIEIVHFHHVMNLCWSLVEAAKRTAKRTYFSLHDYYAYCRRYDLIASNGSFCHFCASEKNCNDPTDRAAYGSPNPDLAAAERRQRVSKILNGVLKIAPSENIKQALVEHMKLQADKISVMPIPGTYDAEQSSRSVRTPSESDAKNLVIGFVGVFSSKKGASTFANIVRAISKDHPNLKWKVFGEIVDFDLAEQLISQFGVEFHGPYNSKSIVSILKRENVEIGLILSNWPETYSLTLSEVMSAGCVPIVSNIGATADRVAQSRCGWVVSATDPVHDMRAILQSVTSQNWLLNSKRALIPTIDNVSLLHIYKSLYEYTS